MMRFGTFLAFVGFGSAVLHFTSIQFRVLFWAEQYQPALGLGIGALGAVIIILKVVTSKEHQEEPEPFGPLPDENDAPQQFFGPPPGQQSDPRQPVPQPGGQFPPPGPMGPPPGHEPAPQHFAPQQPAPQHFAPQQPVPQPAPQFAPQQQFGPQGFPPPGQPYGQPYGPGGQQFGPRR